MVPVKPANPVVAPGGSTPNGGRTDCIQVIGKTITVTDDVKNSKYPNAKAVCAHMDTFDGFGPGSTIYNLANPSDSATMDSNGVIKYYKLNDASVGQAVTIGGKPMFAEEKFLKIKETTLEGDVTKQGNGYQLGNTGANSADKSKVRIEYLETNAAGTTDGAAVTLDFNFHLGDINGGVPVLADASTNNF